MGWVWYGGEEQHKLPHSIMLHLLLGVAHELVELLELVGLLGVLHPALLEGEEISTFCRPP